MVMDKITVLVADDHPLIRDGLVNLLEKEADFDVVGQAADGEEAVRLACEKCPHVVVMDLEMPKVDGVDATKQIKAAHPEISVIVLTIHDGEEYIAALLEAGAAGYLLKNTYGKELVQAIRTARLGKFVLDEQIGPKVFRAFTVRMNKVFPPNMKEALSAKEMEVMKLVARGKTNEEISGLLFVSTATVKDYLSTTFSKLGVSSRTGAVITCLRAGILSLDDVS